MDDMARVFGFGTPDLADNQEMENINYGEKLKNSCCGMGFGFLFFFGFLGIAGWNEYRNVANIQTIKAAREEYKSGTCSPIMSNLEGELVHLTCSITNLDLLGGDDPVLQGVPESERTGLSLKTDMEVYQWSEETSTETKDNKVGGGSTRITTYNYRRRWSTRSPDDINAFHQGGETCKSQNGDRACYNWDPKDESWWNQAGYQLGSNVVIDQSENVKAGDYVLPQSAVSSLGEPEELTPSCASGGGGTSTAAPTTVAPSNSSTRRELQTGVTLSCATGSGNNPVLKNQNLYWQQIDSDGRQIDYLMRSYTIYKATTVSILAEQRGNSFLKWTSPYDDDYGLFIFTDGNKTATEMFDEEEMANKGLTWFLRFFTLVMVVTGLVMITAPLTEIPDIIPVIGPFIGNMIGYMLWAVNCALGCCCWSIVVAFTWIAYRPMVAIPLLCVSVCLCASGGYLVYMNNQNKKHPGGKKIEEEDGEADIEVAEEYEPEKLPDE